MLAMVESASSSPHHVPIHFLQCSTKLPITSIEDRRRRSLIYIDAIDDPHALLPATTHSSDHPNPLRLTFNNSPREPKLHNSVATLAPPPPPRGFVPGRLPDAGQSP